MALAAFCALIVLRGTSLYDPPYWDALLGLFPQAHWQALNGLDPFLLLREQPGYVDGGACVYPFSIVPPLLALLERALPDPSSRFAILHLATFALTGVACAAVFRLVRPFGRGIAWLAAAAFLAQPGVQGLTAQIGLEIPLAAAVVCALASLVEMRFGAAFAAAALALLVKPTGVVVAAVGLAVYCARRLAPRVFGAPATNEGRWAVGHAALLALFAAELGVLRAFERAPPGTGLFSGLMPLFAKRLWTVPEFGLALVVLCLVGVLAWWRRSRTSPVALAVLVPSAFLLAYVGLLVQWENSLPRYFVLAYPAVLALLVASAIRFGPRGFAAPLTASIALLGLLGARGGFQPDRPGAFAGPGEGSALAANDGWLLERSLRFRDGLALDLQIARFAQMRPDAYFVAPWPLQQALVEPSFGYVTRPVACATAEVPVAWTAVPTPSLDAVLASEDTALASEDTAFAGEDRGLASEREVLWILNPVDFAGHSAAPRPGDVLVARFAVGAQRAFIVRRPNFP